MPRRSPRRSISTNFATRPMLSNHGADEAWKGLSWGHGPNWVVGVGGRRMLGDVDVTAEDTPWMTIPLFGCRGITDDPLLKVLRAGARQTLQQVIEAEVDAFLAAHADPRARQRPAAHGARDPDRHQPDSGARAEGSRPWRWCCCRSYALHLKGSPTVPVTDEERRGVAALALFQGRLHGPVQRGIDGKLAWPRCCSSTTFGARLPPAECHGSRASRPRHALVVCL